MEQKYSILFSIPTNYPLALGTSSTGHFLLLTEIEHLLYI